MRSGQDGNADADLPFAEAAAGDRAAADRLFMELYEDLKQVEFNATNRRKVPLVAKQPRTAWRAKMSAYWREERGHPPGHPESRFWTAKEEALLGTDTDAAVGRLI